MDEKKRSAIEKAKLIYPKGTSYIPISGSNSRYKIQISSGIIDFLEDEKVNYIYSRGAPGFICIGDKWAKIVRTDLDKEREIIYKD